MRKHLFAGLLGAAPKADKIPNAPDDAEAMDEIVIIPGEDNEDEDEETAPAVMDGEEDAAPEDGEDTPAAKAEFQRGARAENKRWAAIMAQAKPHTAALACQLAVEGVSPKAAARALALAPAPAAASPAGGRLGAAMKGRDPAPLSAPGDGANPDTMAARMARRFQKKG